MNKSNKPLTKSQARAGLIFLLCLLAFYICLNISITTIQKRIRSHCEENPSKVDVSQYLNEHDSGTAFVFSPKDNTNCSYIIFEILCGGKSATYYFYRSGSWIIIREKKYSSVFLILLNMPNRISSYNIDGKRFSVVSSKNSWHHRSHLNNYSELLVEAGIRLSKN